MGDKGKANQAGNYLLSNATRFCSSAGIAKRMKDIDIPNQSMCSDEKVADVYTDKFSHLLH